MNTIYCKIKEERKGWLGERYFAMSNDNDTVLQICFGGGEPRRGRTNNVGAYFISRLTFISNYFAMNYVDMIDKKDFDLKLKTMLSALEGKVVKTRKTPNHD